MKSVCVTAPGKLLLFGEHAVVFDNPCIVTAVGQRFKLSAKTTRASTITLHAPDVGIDSFSISIDTHVLNDIPKGAQFVCQAIASFQEQYPFVGGLEISTTSEFASTVGFGSSSAATVCMLKALAELNDINLSNTELFALAYKTVLDIQGKGSGFDVAAAIYGGTVYFMRGGTQIEQLDIDPIPLIIGYTGVKADTTALVSKVSADLEANPEKVRAIFKNIKNIVETAKLYLKQHNLQELGLLFDHNQTELKKLGVSSSELDNLIVAARQAGAYGAKLSGAGGGDCMISLASEEKTESVCQAIKQAGGTIIKIPTHVEGVRIESNI